MPDPKELKVGDRVKFISLPDEWSDPLRPAPRESIEFMQAMIARRGSSRIAEFDQFGYPWIRARIRRDGEIEHHYWLITESTGWRKVQPRTR